MSVRQGWSDEELAASVDAYREMARMESSGSKYSKKQVYRDLATRFGRSEKSFEFRMQNISAVLDELGMPWIDGLKPKSNVGAGVKPRLVSLITGETLPALARVRGQPASYKEKLPAVRRWLIGVARCREVVTYTDVMLAFEIDRFSLRHAMDHLGHEAQDGGEPIITALIVGKKSRRCSSGLATEFGVEDDRAERQRLYAYWNTEKIQSLREPVDEGDQTPLSVRAARFASVAVRPDQAAFRRRVFTVWQGRCAVTGCALRQALDAAHRHGRDWRLGHNNASDGLLLRKDLHALYDAGLMTIDSDWRIHLTQSAQSDYSGLQGALIEPPC